ncbi:hypothetical protein Ga0609869_001288 [Rhodovulum iodosum]|uniref:Mitochondrial inner membrane protein n=1 Tax=Rhodovulum iodosum TaxID=68291 RepID=A0ABV3XRH5_9RHOB|nr:hypothetical protein [Rhodovulum robiginosum]
MADRPESEDAGAAATEAQPDNAADDAVAVEEAETVQEPDSPPAKEAPQPAPAKGGSGVFRGIVGGVIAVALGYGAAQYIKPEGFTFPGTEPTAEATNFDAIATSVSESTDRLAALEARIAELGDAVAALPAETGPVEMPAELNETIAGLGEQLSTIDNRLSKLESRPLPTDGAEQVAEAYQREIDEMRAALNEQRARNEELSARVDSVADSAKAEVDQAVTRAALMRINAALDGGGGFDSAVADLDGTEVPAALAEVADDGVATMAELRASFAGYARAALRESLKDAADGAPSDRLSAFLRSQLGARSLEPREGDDPDAVLSRAEAALNAGNLDDALNEIAALPEAGQAEMAPWAERARTRAEAVAAADALADSLNSN